jgi:hypothetical protein
MTNKDLLLLENEFRNELPKYSERPKITAVDKPTQLTSRLSSFLQSANEKSNQNATSDATPPHDGAKMVEMDIYITPTGEP